MATGLSNYTEADYEELEKSGLVKVCRPVVNQIEVSPFLYRKACVDYFQEKHIVIQRSSLCKRGAALQNDVVLRIAQKHSVTAAQVLIKWGLQKGLCVCVKSSHPTRMAENLSCEWWGLDMDDMDQLDALTTEDALKRGGRTTRRGGRGRTGPGGRGRGRNTSRRPRRPEPPPDAPVAVARTGRGASHPAGACVRGGRRRAGAGARRRRRRGHGAAPAWMRPRSRSPRKRSRSLAIPGRRRSARATRLPPPSQSRSPAAEPEPAAMRWRPRDGGGAASTPRPSKMTVAKLRAALAARGPTRGPQGGAPGAAPGAIGELRQWEWD